MNDQEKIKLLRLACKKALDYIGDDKGTCEICGGNGLNLPYSKHCPCRIIRRALVKSKTK